jgi:hypothetical protein
MGNVIPAQSLLSNALVGTGIQNFFKAPGFPPPTKPFGAGFANTTTIRD